MENALGPFLTRQSTPFGARALFWLRNRGLKILEQFVEIVEVDS